ncbi:hypothetical protein PIB30_018189 [Stylosanthes scabra]|uniref:Uncharacterized protein n=1 Tax=Stylosanthes scabra TaxID=79078 RepID=A0ABU6T856_9FABA|nr:hypothetical protein [Stylosanthes scabra]
MAKLSVRSSIKKSSSTNNGLVKLRFALEKLIHKSLLMGSNKKSSSSCVPEDVKEGHFAVIAEGCGGDDEEGPKRFVMPLSCLRNPAFLRLLEQAEEEYGFDHEGALTIPCTPSQLQRILLLEQQQQTINKNHHHLFNFSTNHLQFIIS